MMSKSAIIGVVAAVFVLGLLLGLYVLPGLYAMQVGKEAARQAAPSAISQAIKPLVKEQAQKAASEIAATTVARPRDADIDIQPVPKPDAVAAPVVVTRENFEITLPPGSTVKPENPKYGSERLVQSRLPGNVSLSILLVDDKSNAPSTAESALEELRGEVKEPETLHESTLGRMFIAGVNGIQGLIEGEQFAFEAGYREGREKACVLIIEYPLDSEKKRAATDSIQQAISTLKLKQ